MRKSSSVPTLREALVACHKRNNHKANTHNTYWKDVRTSFGDNQGRPATDITEEVVKQVNRDRKEAGPGGVRVIKTLFRWMKAEYNYLFLIPRPVNPHGTKTIIR